jgi:hypothetical protein
MAKVKVPNTISDKKMASLRARANEQQRRSGGMFTKKAVTQRLASNANYAKRGAN